MGGRTANRSVVPFEMFFSHILVDSIFVGGWQEGTEVTNEGCQL